MLNKDQYNQEEYNDYYQQEIEGAELGSSPSKKTGFKRKLIALLSLLALAIASYFGYKAFTNTSISDNNQTTNVSAKESEPTLPKSVQERAPIEPKEVQSSKKENIAKENHTTPAIQKETLAKQSITEKAIEKKPVEANSSTTQSVVSKVVNKNQSKMSPEEVAAVVAAVMKQMSQAKSSNNNDTVETPNKQDSNLINKLTDLEVDPVSKDLMKELEKVGVDEDAKIESSDQQIDVYNKVNVQNTATNIDSDTLSKLSDEINAVISKETTSQNRSTTKDKSYAESLKSEVVVRKNEMRIIIVREGDTLGKIAKRAYGDAREFKKIYEANPEVTRPDRIYIGQKLRIPN